MKKIVDEIRNGDLLDNSEGDFRAEIQSYTGTILVVSMKDKTSDTEYVVMVAKQEHKEIPPEVPGLHSLSELDEE